MSRDWRLGLVAGIALGVCVLGVLFATGICEIVDATEPVLVTRTPTPFREPTATVSPTVAPAPTATPVPVRAGTLGDGGLR